MCKDALKITNFLCATADQFCATMDRAQIRVKFPPVQD
jgi:hypothetical protein